MSETTFSSEYLYNLPAATLNDFTRVMDSLPDSDWLRFASQVISDQTDLRLVMQNSRRTETLMHKWECRNGTVGELVNILHDLKLFWQRDIILNCRRISQPSSVSPTPNPLNQSSVNYHSSPTSLFTPRKHTTQTNCSSENKLLPRPGPPPAPNLDSSTPCPQAAPKAVRKEETFCESREAQLSLCTSAMCWPVEEVQRGTDNFSAAKQIGEGGFGQVFRASLRNTDFAVKRLKEDSHMGWTVVKESFKTEVERLSQCRHPNIMDLAGYSMGGGTYCLIYSYMPCGSLEDRLHSKNGSALSWSQRVNVALGSARAIQYLHLCSPALIHGDVKSSNILLGRHLEPKLGDFGLARLCRNPGRSPGKTSTVAQTLTVRGTLAYLPDEYLKDGFLGVETDVYSFGVVLLEVLTGRKALETDSQSKTVYLKDLVSEVEDDGKRVSKRTDSQECLLSPAAENIWKKHLDPRLMKEGTSSPHCSKEVAHLACRCLDRRRKRRPPMTEVFKVLQDLHDGWMTLNSSVPSPVSPCPSSPKPLRSDGCSLNSVTHQFSELGPQEDTYCCSDIHSFPRPQSAVTRSESPKSASSEVLYNSLCSSFRSPCESDESQGFSQYLVPKSAAQRSKSQLRPEGISNANSTQSSGFSIVTPMPSSISSDECVIVNPVRQRLVEKMALYEEGRILTSDLFSSAAPSDAAMPPQTREPEESDEFASFLG